MLSSVLHNKRAVQVSIQHGYLCPDPAAAGNPQGPGPQAGGIGGKYDARFRVVFDTIRKLSDLDPSASSHRYPGSRSLRG